VANGTLGAKCQFPMCPEICILPARNQSFSLRSPGRSTEAMSGTTTRISLNSSATTIFISGRESDPDDRFPFTTRGMSRSSVSVPFCSVKTVSEGIPSTE
jgi:hypothetical protein